VARGAPPYAAAVARTTADPRRLAAVAVLAICLVYAVAPPGRGVEHFVDEIIYRRTTQQMRHGVGYYRAMDHALRGTNGPAGSTRAFRTPTVFLLWRWLPGQHAVWLVFVALVALSALLILDLSTSVLAAPLVALYLLRLARPYVGGAWFDQYLVVELWVVPAVVGMVMAWRRDHHWLAAGLALLATAIRELAVLLLIGGLVASWVRRPARRAWPWPWLVALAAAAVGWLVHAHLVHPYLVAHGTEVRLLGSGHPPRTIVRMMAVGLPAKLVVGPLLWALAGWRLRRQPDLAALLSPYLLIPLLGIVIGRDYWGFLVAPIALWLAVEGAAEVLGTMARIANA
jgi:hypothetical protein